MFGWFDKLKSYKELENFSKENEISDYTKFQQKSYKKIMGWYSDKSWTTVKTLDGVLLEEKQYPGSNVNAVRATTELKNVDLKALIDLHYSATFAQKSKTDAELLDCKVLKTLNKNMHIYYSAYLTPPLIGNRDFVSLRCHYRLEDGSDLITTVSINYKDKPFDSNYVRGVVTSAIMIKLVDGDSRNKNRVSVKSIYHIDPKGLIPAWIVNSFKEKPARNLIRLKEIYEK